MMSDHLDLLGREVTLDDPVAFVHHNRLYVGKVIKVTPKQVRIQKFGKINTWTNNEYIKYTNQCVLVGGPDLTKHLLKTL